ncbi:MAG: serine hydrolase [Pirellulales bacterium]|nr:serine hydrolase [Pirellulales bacterium]
MKCTHLLSAVALLIASITNAATLPEQVDRLTQPYVDSKTVIGMTIGVVKGDKTIVRGYGRLSADDSRMPDGQTIYEIGSVSKVFTGLLLADAAVHHRVSLVTPADDLLPEGVAMNRRHESLPIRLWHLSTHTSGLPRLPDNLEPADPNDPYADYNGKHLATFLRKFEPRKRPGEEIAYSNLGAGLLGDLLASERETNYESLLKQRIAESLGLEDTRIELNVDQQSRLASPHAEGGAPDHEWHFDKLGGAGAIRSTVDDLLKFAHAQLHPPKGKLGQAIDLAWQIHQKPLEEGDPSLGLGWHVAGDGSTRWHNGQTGGYHAAVFINRRFDAAAIVLTNTATGEVDALAAQLIRMLAGVDEKPREFEEPVEVDPKVMKRYVGKYQFAPGVVLTVSLKNDQLYVRLTGPGQSTLPISPLNETEWTVKVVGAKLTFDVDKKGRCRAVELFQGGIRQKAKKVK